MTWEPWVLFGASSLAGGLAALLGLGGGLFIVPLLALYWGVPFAEARGASLVCCLATSAAGSVAFDKAKLANFEVVAHLEVCAALGAIGVASIADWIPESVATGVFAVVAGVSAWRMFLRSRRPPPPAEVPAAVEPVRYPAGMALATVAGGMSGLLGIGGGPLKVPLQSEVMKLPLRVAVANSNVMVGITAAVGAAVYYGRGEIQASTTAPCALGVALGAYVGGRLAPRIKAPVLAYLFTALLGYLAVRMGWRAWLLWNPSV